MFALIKSMVLRGNLTEDEQMNLDINLSEIEDKVLQQLSKKYGKQLFFDFIGENLEQLTLTSRRETFHTWDTQDFRDCEIAYILDSDTYEQLEQKLRILFESFLFNIDEKNPAHYQVKIKIREEGPDFGDVIIYNFKARNDYYALLGIIIQESPTIENVFWHFGDDIHAIKRDYPTAEALAEHIHKCYSGEDDNLVYYLRNLDTGEELYGVSEPVTIITDTQCDSDLDLDD